jgi:hypothetical protein
LDRLECAFPSRPVVVTDRIDPNVKAAKVFDLSRQLPGTVFDLNSRDRNLLLGTDDSEDELVAVSQFCKSWLDEFEVLRAGMAADLADYERPSIRLPRSQGGELRGINDRRDNRHMLVMLVSIFGKIGAARNHVRSFQESLAVFEGHLKNCPKRPYVGLTYETKTASSKSKTIGSCQPRESHSTTGGPKSIASLAMKHHAGSRESHRQSAERCIEPKRFARQLPRR